jgi:aromatic ring-opening dioxygenase catalytic subunit (LigB family)
VEPVDFIPHGGGPCFFMDWKMGPADTWDRMGAWLRTAGDGARPKALLAISGHWEERGFSLTGAPRPPLIYDYSGFPPHTYQLQYPAPGSPDLALRVRDVLVGAGLASRVDPERGWDHGVFIPLKLMYSEADVPVVQMSLDSSLDPELHLRAGAALEGLRSEGVRIIGSGMTYHNMRQFGTRAGAPSEAFDAWLTGAVTGLPEERDSRLRRWADAPFAREAHPREEHLIPLLVASGAGGADRGRRVFSDVVLGARVSAYRFG